MSLKKILKEFSEFCNIVLCIIIGSWFYKGSLSSVYSTFFVFYLPNLSISKWANNIPWPVLRLINFFYYFYHGKQGFPANIYLMNRWQSENIDLKTYLKNIKSIVPKKIDWGRGKFQLLCSLSGKPSDLYQTKSKLWSFSNSSSFDIWTFWLLVTLCSTPRDL